jgi:hypothetical protein
MITQQNSGRLDAMFLGDLDDRLGAEERAARAAQRAVGHDVDALFLAKVDNLLLRERRVVLDLVDGGNDGGVGEELFKVALAVLFTRGKEVRCGSIDEGWGEGETNVGNADGPGFARLEQLLHLLPSVDVVVAADDVTLAIGEFGEAVVVP